MLRKIYLHPPLAAAGSEPILAAIDDCYELIRYLRAFVPGFWKLFKSLDRVGFVRKTGDQLSAVTGEEFKWSLGNTEEVHVVPVLAGSGAAAAVAIGLEGAAAIIAEIAINIAVSYAISYIMQSMQTTPETEDLKPDQASTLFTGGRTLDRQGQRIPLVYGRTMANGVRVNINYQAQDASLAQTDYISLIAGQNAQLNIFANDRHLINPVVQSYVVNGTTKQAGESYALPYGHGSITVNANGDVLVTTNLGAYYTRKRVEIFATDNGLSIPQNLMLDIEPLPPPRDFGA